MREDEDDYRSVALFALYFDFIEKDKEKARAKYKFAARQGFSEAQYCYAQKLKLGEGGKQNLLKARLYFQLAADQGHPKAQHEYASMLLSGEGGEKDEEKAHHYFKLAQTQNNKVIMSSEQDFNATENSIKRAADGGSAQCQYLYAIMLYLDENRTEDALEEARHYCKLAADEGYSPAQSCFSIMLFLEKIMKRIWKRLPFIINWLKEKNCLKLNWNMHYLKDIAIRMILISSSLELKNILNF